MLGWGFKPRWVGGGRRLAVGGLGLLVAGIVMIFDRWMAAGHWLVDGWLLETE